jgi:hypothetical protein
MCSALISTINISMKIVEIIQPKTPSAINSSVTQAVVPQDIASEECVSAIAEGISQIFRRGKGGKLKTGFRCTSGSRRGRIVAKPSTCNARLNPVKGAKIRQKRQAKAAQSGVKMAFTKRATAGSKRLKGLQVSKKSRALQKSKIIRPKK